MSRHNWSRLKKDSPVDIIPSDFYQDAKNLELKMTRVENKEGLTSKKSELVKINEELTGVVQDLQKNLNKVYERANNYNRAAQGIYKLIDINLRFYRFSQIEKQFNKMDQNHGEPSEYRLQRVLSNMRTMLNTIYESIQYANDGFKEREEIDDEVVYIVDLADYFELSIRYFAQYQSDQEEDTVDYFEELEKNNMGEALDEIEEDNAEFVEETENEMEEMFDNMEVG